MKLQLLFCCIEGSQQLNKLWSGYPSFRPDKGLAEETQKKQHHPLHYISNILIRGIICVTKQKKKLYEVYTDL